jgi:phosphoglycolate phosphatase-like HAD superfamily hydrolase
MGGDKLLPKACGLDAESDEGKRVNDRRLAVASSAKEDELGPLLKVCGADRVVEAATSSDDADRSKPDPDIVRAALDRVGLPPDEVVLIGDTPYDVEAGRRAGVRVIALRCGGWGDADLRADAVYDDPADLAADLDRSPLAP